MRQKLSVLVPCKNERLNIRPCIDGFRELADEILIADSGSNDGTLDIVRSLGGCRIIQREYRTYGDFINWAIPQASHPWVLLIDADERVTPKLADEIRSLLAQRPTKDGYLIYRASYFLGHRLRYGGLQRDCCLRLFARDLGRVAGPSDHGVVRVTGSVGALRTRLLHYSYWTYEQWLRKCQRYAYLQAQQWHEAGRRPSFWNLLFRLPLRFLRAYVVQLGFLDGAAGLQWAALQGIYSYLKQARLWELHYALTQPDPEADRLPSQGDILRLPESHFGRKAA
jgi:glycosyltransferase involved in cell wall biosynthesis